MQPQQKGLFSCCRIEGLAKAWNWFDGRVLKVPISLDLENLDQSKDLGPCFRNSWERLQSVDYRRLWPLQRTVWGCSFLQGLETDFGSSLQAACRPIRLG